MVCGAVVILCARAHVLPGIVDTGGDGSSGAGSIDNPVMDDCGKWFGYLYVTTTTTSSPMPPATTTNHPYPLEQLPEQQSHGPVNRAACSMRACAHRKTGDVGLKRLDSEWLWWRWCGDWGTRATASAQVSS